MNTRFLIAALIASAIGFLGGWLIWGLALDGYFSAHTSPGAKALQRAEGDMVWWAMIVAQLAWGFVITWIIQQTGSTTMRKGALTAVIVMALFILGIDLFFYAMMEMFTDFMPIIVDIIANCILAAIIGAFVGWFLGRGQRIQVT